MLYHTPFVFKEQNKEHEVWKMFGMDQIEQSLL